MRALLRNETATENAYVIHKELGEVMTNNMTVVRYNDKLEETIVKIKELKAALSTISTLPIRLVGTIQGVAFTRQLWNMLELVRSDDTRRIAA